MNARILPLVDLWRRSLEMKSAGQWNAAADVIARILREQPDWEHGYGAFNLAECYEQLGRIGDARTAYESAASRASSDRTLVGGLASFLFLHGEPSEAFDQYVRLLILDRKQEDEVGMSAASAALRALGAKLNWSTEEVESRISAALSAME